MSTINNTKSAFDATRNAMVSTMSTTKKTVDISKKVIKTIPTAVKNSWDNLPESTKAGAMFIGAEMVAVAAANLCNYGASKSSNPKMVKCFTHGKKYYSALALGYYLVGEAVLCYSSFKTLKDAMQPAKKLEGFDKINADIARMSEEITKNTVKPSIQFDHDVQPDYKLDEDESSVDHDQF